MSGGIVALASGVLLTGCSAFGIRTVEQPPYRKLAQIGAVEIRSYGPRLAAETVVAGSQIATRNAGFRRLAAFIFGANRSRASIAMTAPVAQSREAVAMTAPVDQAQDRPGEWRIRFFMPSHYTLATLPMPLDPAVRIVTVPGETIGVLRYSGIPSSQTTQDANARLLGILAGGGWTAAGLPMAWFYDPPWTIPPLRRNEAAVLVTPPGGK